ncbi:unnamed protein product, partial [Laminaria digitata]
YGPGEATSPASRLFNSLKIEKAIAERKKAEDKANAKANANGEGARNAMLRRAAAALERGADEDDDDQEPSCGDTDMRSLFRRNDTGRGWTTRVGYSQSSSIFDSSGVSDLPGRGQEEEEDDDDEEDVLQGEA